jgi:L-threonylcarbamoyladenylate synthase
LSAREIGEAEASRGDGLLAVVDAIRRRGVIAYPAETMYGLGGDGLDRAVASRIAAMKGSRTGRPFLLLLAGIDQWEIVAGSFPEEARSLADRWWPGPLTILLPAREDCAAGKGGKVAVRVPDLPVVRAWARESGRPLLSTSANLAGGAPARSPEVVRAQFGRLVDLLVTGPVFPASGAPSTIIDGTTSPPRLVRAGAVPFSDTP